MYIKCTLCFPVCVVPEAMNPHIPKPIVIWKPGLGPVQCCITRFRPSALGTTAQAMYKDQVGYSCTGRLVQSIQSQWSLQILRCIATFLSPCKSPGQERAIRGGCRGLLASQLVHNARVSFAIRNTSSKSVLVVVGVGDSEPASTEAPSKEALAVQSMPCKRIVSKAKRPGLPNTLGQKRHLLDL